MFTNNNSDTDWLVYADYLQDQDINSSYIREAILEPQTNQWCHEFVFNENVVGTIDYPNRVGSITIISKNVGVTVHNTVGSLNSSMNIVGCGHQGVGTGRFPS